MEKEIEDYLKSFPFEIKNLFLEIRDLVIKDRKVKEKMWAKLPSFYVNKKFIRIIPFKNHINIEAEAILNHVDELKNYKLTPKGMLKIGISDVIPDNLLLRIFKETLA